MKHSVQELVDIAYSYFPRGIDSADPRYPETPEVLRQKAARIPASERYEDWRAMLRRIQARIEERQLPQASVESRCFFLQIPTAGRETDRCYTATIHLPIRSPKEKHHNLVFLVSFVVPYYAIHSECHVFLPEPVGRIELDLLHCFELTPDELPYASIVAEEIGVTFPGYERISPEVGMTVIPDVGPSGKFFGEATLFSCLFSDHPWTGANKPHELPDHLRGGGG